MWTYKYLLSVALVTAAVVAVGAVMWGRDTPSIKPAPVAPGDYVRGDPNAAVTIDLYPDFG